MINPCLTYSMFFFIERDFRFLSGEVNWNDGTEQMHRTSYYKNPRKCLGEGHSSGMEEGKAVLYVIWKKNWQDSVDHVCMCAHAHARVLGKRECEESRLLALVLGTWCCHVARREDWRRIRVFWGEGLLESRLVFSTHEVWEAGDVQVKLLSRRWRKQSQNSETLELETSSAAVASRWEDQSRKCREREEGSLELNPSERLLLCLWGRGQRGEEIESGVTVKVRWSVYWDETVACILAVHTPCPWVGRWRWAQ